MSLCKQELGARKTTSNTQVLPTLGKLLFEICIETQMFKSLQLLPFLEKNTYLRKVINEEIKITNWGWIANFKFGLNSKWVIQSHDKHLQSGGGRQVRRTTKTNTISFKKDLQIILFRTFSHRLKTNIKRKLIWTF